jgi:hypothetical protein
MTQIAFTYSSIARIMNANGYSDEEIKNFLVANQNETGYIPQLKIPPVKPHIAKPISVAVEVVNQMV